ncbi:hypothetical protein BGW36DRAFT_460917 [Talaromyces proteolyticus]|uniref:Zn(2)-C6 fungal-type domain-containing protein n=1 Tax=Talaromyces proteolyticus TaxID=1131652 RepID=A0AAD4Q1W8_9EURO|nr:uncharacterized protein BGW36DRAFT_460917 [Talaromyces proteolyticus]KAH8699134.1 hypothetical protein BGW36DRAFT_460917 [Talaromyces proteolyticus]
MVYPGHRSTGCIECRRRKVKCDAAKPECYRCTIRGHICPGYPDRFNFRPLLAEVVKQGRRRQPSKSDTTTTSESTSQSKSGKTTTISSCPRHTSSIPLSPSTAWELPSLCFFIDQYIIPSPDGVSPGYLRFIPDLYHVQTENSCLKSAMLAVSYLTLYNRTGDAQLYVNCRDNYGIALGRINTALNNPEFILTDKTLASIIILSLFVDVNNERHNLLNVHSLGIYRLVKLQRDKLVHSKNGLYLFGWAVSHLLIQSIIRGEDRHVELMHLLNPDDLKIYELKFARIVCKILAFRSLVKQFTALRGSMAGPALDQQEHNLTGIACHLLAEIDAWDRDMPPDWQSALLGLPSEAAEAQPGTFQCIVAFLSLVSSVRIIFYLNLIQWCNVCGDLLSPLRDSLQLEDDANTASVLQSRIYQYLRNISKSASDALRESDNNGVRSGSAAVSLIILWPTWLVVHCPLSTPELVSQSRQTLNIIGHKIGIKLAVILYTLDSGPIDKFT